MIDKPSIKRMNLIAALYYAGYSRWDISRVFNISRSRIAQILSRHARWNRLEWPPRSMTGGFGTRRDAPKHYKTISAEAMHAAEVVASGIYKRLRPTDA